MTSWLDHKKKKKKKKKKKTCFTGRSTDLPSRVGLSGVFFFSGSKNDPKNTKILKKNLTFFCQKNLEKYFELVSNIFS